MPQAGSVKAKIPTSNGYAVTFQNNIHFPENDYKEDFSKSHVYDQAWLVHEVGHVWQYQTNPKYSWFKAMFDRSYGYELEHGKKLLDYGWEQQPSIIADAYVLGKGAMPTTIKGADQLTPQQLPELQRKYDELLNPHGLGRTEESAPAPSSVAAQPPPKPE
jgi:hypothetical protein